MTYIRFCLLVLFAACTTPAMAQESAKPPPFNWTGFYVGAQGGYQTGESRITEFFAGTGLPTGFAPLIDIDGWSGGAHLGYNHQFDSWVVGVEADAELADIRGRYRGLVIFDSRQDWEASARLRLGVTPIDRLLIYATGGLAVTGVKSRFDLPTVPLTGTWHDTATGWTFGAGLQYAITDHVSVRGEYRYSDYGKVDFNWPDAGGSYEHSLRTNAFRVGFSYSF